MRRSWVRIPPPALRNRSAPSFVPIHRKPDPTQGGWKWESFFPFRAGVHCLRWRSCSASPPSRSRLCGRRTTTRSAVVPLVSDQPGVAAAHRSEPRQRLGTDLEPDEPVVGRRQRHRQVDALPRLRRTAAGARRRRARRADGHRLQSDGRLSLPTGGKALFLFDTEEGKVLGWNGAQGTDAVVVANLDDGAIYKGLAIAQRAAAARASTRPTSTTRKVDVFDGSFGLVHDSGFVDPSAAERLRAVRHPDDRRPRLRHLREAGRGRRGRGGRPGQGLRRRLRPDGQPARTRRPARPAERTVGPRDGA